MVIKELIERLKKLDQEKEIGFYDDEYSRIQRIDDIEFDDAEQMYVIK